MKTTFKQPDMQDAGEECESCRTFWDHLNLPPKRLEYLLDAKNEVITTEGGIPIVICPRCDGDWIKLLPKDV